ncbi:MAG: putative outer rane usher transrane protein [Panacagrimonas sp.]|nr:fimbria/pilus outer membrane usher protein [Panacagrimonas sp.]MCC2658030.1 putative outer rane usher transrane protein [Panacagrimonas sp.]
MSRWPRPERAALLRDHLRVVLTAWWLAGAALPCATSAADLEPVWLAVHPTPDASAVDGLLLRDERGGLWAQRGDLNAWGVIEPGGEPVTRDEIQWYPLDAQTALRARFDAGEQSLWLQVDPQLRTLQVRSLRDARRLDADEDRGEVGGWLDADVQVARGGAGQSLQPAGLFALNGFDGRGFATTTALATRDDFVRLDSTWSFERADALERVDLGDGIVRAGAWGRSLRFGGISMGTDFSLQPDLVTFPQPELRGVAELPSTLDVYVNGMLAREERIDAGPFVLSDMPVQDGANRTRVVVRDILGREQVLSQAFYAPAQLLRPGLRETRLDAGWLRRDYGLHGFDYGSGFAAASLRQGRRDWLTSEWRGESGLRRQAGGASVALALPWRLGTTEFALAGSHARVGEGALLRAGYDWHGSSGWSLGARWRRPLGDWTDLGEERRVRNRRQLSASLGFVPASGWTGALTWARLRERDEGTQSLVSLGLSTRVARRWHLGASLVRADTRDASADLRVGLTLVGSFGSGTTVIDSSRRLSGPADDDAVSMEWQRRTDAALDPSLRLRAQRGDYTDRLQAEGRWPGERGQFDVALARDGATGGAAWRLGGSSRLAWLGGDHFWTRAGSEGFTVIDTHGLADVGVLQDQRLAARTDARGLALIPGLRPYEPNRFALVDADVPIEASVDSLDRVVTPSARGAVRVDFAVQGVRGRGFRLLLPDGEPLPPGTRVRDPYSGLRAAMGRDGRAWWPHGDGLPDRLEVERAHQTCEARVPRNLDTTSEPVLTLVCRESA